MKTLADYCSQEDRIAIVNGLYLLCQISHRIAVDKGWWEEDRNDYECVALMHSELSEAVEGLRAGNLLSDKLGDLGFCQVEEEFADCLIRMADLAWRRDWDLARAVVAKFEYNAGREYRHGGKKA